MRRYYSCDKFADYSFADLGDAIEERVEEIYPDLPERLTVYHFEPIDISAEEPCLKPRYILEHILEILDEDYGWDDSSEPTEKMLEAAKVFADVIREEYEVHQLKDAGSEDIDLRQWIKENDPEPDPELLEIQWVKL